MASQLTYANLFSESWQNVYDLINSRSNIADPTTPSSQFRKMVYTREPDVKALDFKGYPYIVAHPTEVDMEDGGSVDGKSKFITFSAVIDMVASDRGYGKQEGLGHTQMRAMSDDVFEHAVFVSYVINQRIAM